MALINCPECGKEISNKAAACPNCGAPVPQNEHITTDTKKTSKSESNNSYAGIIAIGLGIAAVLMPYFAAVFLVPATFIAALIAIKQKQQGFGAIGIILSIIGLIGIIQVSNQINQASEQIEQAFEDPFNNQNVDKGSLTVTYEEYQKIQKGMTYEEVKEIIGEPGEQLSSSSFNDNTFTMYSWSNPGVSNMNAQFENNILTTKAQFGLQ